MDDGGRGPARGERGWRAALGGLQWLLLGSWIGAWFLFAFSVAPTAFRSVPSEQAGAIVGPVIATLHFSGAVAGLALAALAWRLRRGAACVALPLAMAALCLASELAVTPRIDAVRDLAFGPAARAEATAAFWRLHGISMLLFTAVGVGGLALAGLLAWRDARPAGSARGESAPELGDSL